MEIQLFYFSQATSTSHYYYIQINGYAGRVRSIPSENQGLEISMKLDLLGAIYLLYQFRFDGSVEDEVSIQQNLSLYQSSKQKNRLFKNEWMESYDLSRRSLSWLSNIGWNQNIIEFNKIYGWLVNLEFCDKRYRDGNILSFIVWDIRYLKISQKRFESSRMQE